MNSELLYRALVAGEIVTAILIFIVLIKIAQTNAKEKNTITTEPDTQEPQASRLQAQINSLQDELKKAKASYIQAQSELQNLKKIKSESTEDLLRKKEAYDANILELKQVKKEISVLKDEISSKEQEQKKILSHSLAIEEELEKGNEELQSLQKENKELAAKLEGLEAHIANFNKDIATKDSTIAELENEISELKDEISSKEQEQKKVLSYRLSLEGELEKRDEAFQALEKKNKELAAKLQDLEAHIAELNMKAEAKDSAIAEFENKTQESLKVAKEDTLTSPPRSEAIREQAKKKIGEILLKYNFITKDILDAAVEYQKQYGGSITQYLLFYGYINESQLTQCLCTQFGIPYLPLASYDIPEEIIKLVPVDIAEKYWVIPVNKQGNFLMVVMADPLDTNAAKKVEEVTGLKVMPFVGIFSEIIAALEVYYNIIIKQKESESKKTIPFFIDTKTYKGLERRDAVRFKTRIDVSFPAEDHYKKSVIKNVSRGGFLFNSDSALPIGSLVTLEIHLPREFSPLPIAVITQVVRVTLLADNKFEIAVKTIKISKQELATIIDYASTHKEEDN